MEVLVEMEAAPVGMEAGRDFLCSCRDALCCCDGGWLLSGMAAWRRSGMVAWRRSGMGGDRRRWGGVGGGSGVGSESGLRF
ncbi:hypothetical protein KY290_005497 [Solanum tuberosum]|uniref:Uncharacterized protein n=1 Tax=Solanum tuberosum TaxID=4113 RepID=A0ABQ7WGF7_SOLTU|nr:hypothetical protein KY290_005497 [Solanum tuberosum]